MHRRGKTLIYIKEFRIDKSEDTSGLFRIYAILYIIASSCMATVILFPIAMLPGLVATVILAILFFRAAEAEPQVEFV
jgi:hypothetical protein